MRVIIFSARRDDERFLSQANATHAHTLSFVEARLSVATASLARGFEAVCAFVNDQLDALTLGALHAHGVRLIALRSAGFNHVDLRAAHDLGLTIARVPAYSPHAVAEHTVALLLTLNRKTHRAYNRVREGNFALDGLLGFDLHGRTVGVIGAGKIGEVFATIMRGFGCEVLVYDPQLNEALVAQGATHVSLEALLERAQIISLHCPLTPATHHLISAQRIARMRDGVTLLNTSRGALLDTRAVIAALKSGKIGLLGLDVYEEEGDLFFQDLSQQVIQDDVFARLQTFPNVLITGHQGFFTEQAMRNIAATTLGNITAFATGQGTLHEVTDAQLAG